VNTEQPWLTDITLKGREIRLETLVPGHRDALLRAASDGRLWELWFTSVPSERTIDAYIDFALSEKDQGRALPFVVIHELSGQVIGSTRYCNATPSHLRVEIGYTWYSKSHQQTAVNSETKLLLLTHAFESLNCIAVEFRTHVANQSSRKAIERLGAHLDGILRNHQILPNGSIRDTVVYSILDSEWPETQAFLRRRLSIS